MKQRIYLSSPHMSEEGYEKFYIKNAFDTNWIAPLGENVDQFENELKSMVNSCAAAALVSGTAALHMALKAAGVSKGDYVVCQSLTFSASANPIIYEGAIPVFVDSEMETWNMCPRALEIALIKYNPKAVIVVNLYGNPAKLDEIKDLCSKYNVVMIEDAAESLGALYKGKYTGTFGKYGVYSFNGNKIITTSGGGMVISDDCERIEKIRFWSTQARDNALHYQHSELGYNYRLSNVLAGIGRGQLKVIDQRIAQKQKIYNTYKEGLSDISDITMMPLNKDGVSNCWLSCFLLSDKSKISPLDVIQKLAENNIEARPIWKPLHMQPFFRQYCFVTDSKKGINCEKIFTYGVCLPSDTKNTEVQMKEIIQIIRKLWEK